MDRERGLKTAAENSVIGRGTRGGRAGRGERLVFFIFIVTSGFQRRPREAAAVLYLCRPL